MRYNCANASSFDNCAASDWCSWTEDEAGGGRCQLSYDDADVTHMLMWSGTGIACNGSRLAQLVACTFKADESVCGRETGCTWVEGACYSEYMAPLLTKPKLLEAFKAKVCTGARRPCACAAKHVLLAVNRRSHVIHRSAPFR